MFDEVFTYVSFLRTADDQDEVNDDELDGGREGPLMDCTSLKGPFLVETIQGGNLIQTLYKEILN